MLSTRDIILEYLCPAAGMVMGNIMFFAPLRAVVQAKAAGTLGELNPMPWAFQLGNCCGWVVYGILIHNFFVYFANAPGFLLAVYFNLQAIPLQYENYKRRQTNASIVCALDEELSTRQQSSISPLVMSDKYFKEIVDRASASTLRNDTNGTLRTTATSQHERLVMMITAVWLAIISVIVFGQDALDQNARELIVGIAVNLNLVVFYAAPLSTIWTVLTTRSAASIHIPLMIASTLNGTFWCVYGIVVNDLFIAVPNGLGAGLGVIQMVLCVLFPRTLETTTIMKQKMDQENGNMLEEEEEVGESNMEPKVQTDSSSDENHR